MFKASEARQTLYLAKRALPRAWTLHVQITFASNLSILYKIHR